MYVVYKLSFTILKTFKPANPHRLSTARKLSVYKLLWIQSFWNTFFIQKMNLIKFVANAATKRANNAFSSLAAAFSAGFYVCKRTRSRAHHSPRVWGLTLQFSGSLYSLCQTHIDSHPHRHMQYESVNVGVICRLQSWHVSGRHLIV